MDDRQLIDDLLKAGENYLLALVREMRSPPPGKFEHPIRNNLDDDRAKLMDAIEAVHEASKK